MEKIISGVEKADQYTKSILARILDEGTIDINPRTVWEDGTPAHTLSVNCVLTTYNLAKGEFPLITLRPIAVKSSIGELLWIYQDQSNDLDVLKEKYGVTWWDSWDIGNRTIGSCYGETVRKHDLMNILLRELVEDPFGRRHIINLWQNDDFKQPHGLKPCAFLTMWTVRNGKDGIRYLDMSMVQRSSDFCAAGCINQVQYAILLQLVAHCTGYVAGVFTWYAQNVQIYDRHVNAAQEMILRQSIPCNPSIWINPEKTDFYSITKDDIKVCDYPRETISKINEKINLEIAI